MACSESGDTSKITRSHAAQHHAHHHAASSRRSVCCTPRASSSVSSTASTAPTKAAPVSPSGQPLRIPHGHGRAGPPTMPPAAHERHGHPQRCARGAAQQVRVGQRVAKQPLRHGARQAQQRPGGQAPRVRGRRMSHTICQAMGSAASPQHSCQNPCCPRWCPAAPAARRARPAAAQARAPSRAVCGGCGAACPGPWCRSLRASARGLGRCAARMALQAGGHEARGLGHARAGAHHTSDSSGVNTHRRCRAARASGPSRGGTMPSALRAPTMMRSGSARTTNSGLSLGTGPSDPARCCARPGA
jgi:hypothetical protein